MNYCSQHQKVSIYSPMRIIKPVQNFLFQTSKMCLHWITYMTTNTFFGLTSPMKISKASLIKRFVFLTFSYRLTEFNKTIKLVAIMFYNIYIIITVFSCFFLSSSLSFCLCLTIISYFFFRKLIKRLVRSVMVLLVGSVGFLPKPLLK